MVDIVILVLQQEDLRVPTLSFQCSVKGNCLVIRVDRKDI